MTQYMSQTGLELVLDILLLNVKQKQLNFKNETITQSNDWMIPTLLQTLKLLTYFICLPSHQKKPLCSFWVSVYLLFLFKNKPQGIPWQCSGQDSARPLQREQVQFLVGGPVCHWEQPKIKKKKQATYTHTHTHLCTCGYSMWSIFSAIRPL